MKDISTEIQTSDENERVIEYAGHTFYIIYNTDSLKTDKIVFYDAVIVEAGDPEFTRTILTRIRGHISQDHYLKPVFLLKGSTVRDPYINLLIDGVIYSLEQIKLILPAIQNILLRTKDLSFTRSLSFEAQIVEKTLTFMYTREMGSLDPIPDFHSGIGYSYPILSVNFQHHDEHNVIDIIKIMHEENLIGVEFHDSVYLCKKCTSGYLSYREVCPKCNSSNAESQDVIHHFPCGYVGPISDFTNQIDDELNCPKCNKTLRHIGVDYDKPSVIHDCLSCGHRYQDFNVKAKCITCGFDNDVEQLTKRIINQLSITKKGELVAVNGYVSTSKDLEDIIGTVKFQTFKTMFRYEIERLRQTEGKSNLCMIHLQNAGEVYSKIDGELQKTLLKDIVQVIRKNIRTSDVITFYSSSTILLAMNDIPLKIAKRLLQDIVELLKKLLETNFEDLIVNIEFEVKAIKFDISSDLQIQQLVKDYL